MFSIIRKTNIKYLSLLYHKNNKIITLNNVRKVGTDYSDKSNYKFWFTKILIMCGVGLGIYYFYKYYSYKKVKIICENPQNPPSVEKYTLNKKLKIIRENPPVIEEYSVDKFKQIYGNGPFFVYAEKIDWVSYLLPKEEKLLIRWVGSIEENESIKNVLDFFQSDDIKSELRIRETCLDNSFVDLRFMSDLLKYVVKTRNRDERLLSYEYPPVIYEVEFPEMATIYMIKEGNITKYAHSTKYYIKNKYVLSDFLEKYPEIHKQFMNACFTSFDICDLRHFLQYIKVNKIKLSDRDKNIIIHHQKLTSTIGYKREL